MNILKLGQYVVLYTCCLGLLLACGAESNTQKQVKAGVVKKTKTKKPLKKQNQWDRLKGPLKLTEIQVKKLKAADRDFVKKRKAVPLVKGKKDAKQLKALQVAHAKKQSSILSSKQLKQKKEIDKKNRKVKKSKKKKSLGYWQRMKAPLKLTDKQLTALLAAYKEFAKQQKKLPKVKGKIDSKLLKPLKDKLSVKYKKILSAEQLRIKQKLDKQIRKKNRKK